MVMMGLAPRGSAWQQPPQWGLHLTQLGEAYLPFARYVRQLPRPGPAIHQRFELLLDLPVELLVMILVWPDPATLFRLRQTCKCLRSLADDVFWSRPDVWFKVSGDWVLAGAMPGATHCDMDFLANVRRVEVGFDARETLCFPVVEQPWAIRSALPARLLPVRRARADQFWRTIRRCLPRVTHVILGETNLSQVVPAMPQSMRYLAERCPLGLTVQVSSLQPESVASVRPVCSRRLWKQDRRPSSNAGTVHWELADGAWGEWRIEPPCKPLRGLVGEIVRIQHCARQFIAQRDALELLHMEAVERHHFGASREPLTCGDGGCAARFGVPGEWTRHAIRTWHTKPTPYAFQATMLRELHRMEAAFQTGYMEPKLGMRRQWACKRKRPALRAAMLAQLETDPLFVQQEGAQGSLLWQQILLMLEPDKGEDA